MNFKAILRVVTQPIFIISVAVVVALASIALAYVFTTPHSTGSYVNPTRGTIVEEVDAPGTVTAANTVDLSFDTSGRIAYVGAPVGAHVAVGATLATLSGADLSAALEQAKAGLAVQQAKLAGLQAGARPEDIALAQTAVAAAQTALAQSEQAIIQASQNGYVESDDAIHNKVDAFFNNPRTSSPTLVFSLSNSQDQSSMAAGRIAMETLLSNWQAYLAAIPADASVANTTDIITQTQNYLSKIGSYLNLVGSGLTGVVPTSVFPSATIQADEVNIAAGRANISAAMTGINAAQTQEKSAAAALVSPQSQLPPPQG